MSYKKTLSDRISTKRVELNEAKKNLGIWRSKWDCEYSKWSDNEWDEIRLKYDIYRDKVKLLTKELEAFRKDLARFVSLENTQKSLFD